jgi:hypothetical protein
MLWTAFWGVLSCFGLISVTLFKATIGEDGIILKTSVKVPILEKLYLTTSLSFDDIHVKPLLNGRVLLFTCGEKVRFGKKLSLLGGIWVIPYKWKELLQVLKSLKPSIGTSR